MEEILQVQEVGLAADGGQEGKPVDHMRTASCASKSNSQPVQLLSHVRLSEHHHQLLEHAQAHVHQAGDAIQPSHLLLSPSSPTFNLSQHQGLFHSVSSSHQVAKVLGLPLQHQSLQ